MSGSRRRYTREFKIEAIRRMVEDGQAQKTVADDLGVNVNTLAAWKRQLTDDPAYRVLSKREVLRWGMQFEFLRSLFCLRVFLAPPSRSHRNREPMMCWGAAVHCRGMGLLASQTR